MKTRYKIPTKCLGLAERTYSHYLSGSGAEAKFETRSLGWYALFQGSWEALYLGEGKPDFDIGDAILLTIERYDAIPR